MKEATKYRIDGYSRYYFDKHGNAFNDATGKEVTRFRENGGYYYLISDVDTKSKKITHAWIREQVAAKVAVKKSAPATLSTNDYTKIVKGKYKSVINQGVFGWYNNSQPVIDYLVNLLQGKTFNEYVEFFVGNGSTCQALSHLVTGQKILFDPNRYVVNTLIGISKNPASVHEVVSKFFKSHSIQQYYTLRWAVNDLVLNSCISSAFIYLKRASHGGIWRADKQGNFNLGCTKKPKITPPTFEQIKALSDALQGARIMELTDGYFTIENSLFIADVPTLEMEEKYSSWIVDLYKSMIGSSNVAIIITERPDYYQVLDKYGFKKEQLLNKWIIKNI